MPRDRGGIGRTGRKHKNKPKFDLHRRLKSEAESTVSVLNALPAKEPQVELESAEVPISGMSRMRFEQRVSVAQIFPLPQGRAGFPMHPSCAHV